MSRVNINRFRNILAKLNETANKSHMNNQHAAVIINNGKPIMWGFNCIIGNKTCHAECNVINKYLSSSRFIGYVKKRCFLWN